MRRAILIASANFDADSGIEPLRFPKNDVTAFESVLRSQEFGYDVRKVIDKPNNEVFGQLDQLVSKSEFDDFILIYFSGHGKINSVGELFLSCRNTNESLLNSTGLKYRHIIDLLEAHRRDRVAIILDCCYAGRAVSGLKGSIEEQLKSELDSGRGIFVLGAAGATQTAEEREREGHGIFTKQIIEGLTSGAADLDNDGRISLNDLAKYVRDELRKKKISQDPIAAGIIKSGDLILGINRRTVHSRTVDTIRLKFAKARPHFSKATYRAIEDYLDEISKRSDFGSIEKEQKFQSLRAFATGGLIEEVILAFHSLQPPSTSDRRLISQPPLSSMPSIEQARDAAAEPRARTEQQLAERMASVDPFPQPAMQVFSEARDRMLRGVDILAHAVRVTLGPKGRGVMLVDSSQGPRFTKAGSMVAKVAGLEGKFENMGAQMMRVVASSTSDVVGDGATTATVIAHAIVTDGTKAVAAGVNPMQLKRGVDLAVEAVIGNLKKNSKRVTSNERIAQVATTSANGDGEIGRFISEALKKVGNEGVIIVEEAKSFESELEVVDGLQFDRGYISPYFATNAPKMRVEMEDPYILISEKKHSALNELLPLLEAVMRTRKPLLIIALDVEGEALAALVADKQPAGLKVAAVKAPSFSDNRKAMLQDIAIVTAGNFISEDIGTKLESVTLNMLGRAKKVIIEKENTIIVGGHAKRADIDARIQQIKTEIEETTSDYDREKLQQRLANLAGGVAVIRVGGATEVEIKERKEFVDKALHAAHAALEEGILPGGGVALLRATEALKRVKTQNDGQKTGLEIVKKAITWPARQIAINAGEDGSVVVSKILEKDQYNYGFDAQTGEYCNLVTEGIIDPTKVVCVALQHAVSVSSLLITGEVIMAEFPNR